MLNVTKSVLGRVLSSVANKPGCVQFHRPACWRDVEAVSTWARRSRPHYPRDLAAYYERIHNETKGVEIVDD